jgi:hypothetical protein
MKVRLGFPVSDVSVIEMVLKQGLPHYRYSFRNGRLHRFLVVSGDSYNAAIVYVQGSRIKVFAGFSNEWVHGIWGFVMLTVVPLAIGGIVLFAQGKCGDVASLLGPLAIVAGLEFARRQATPIVRDVVACIEKGLL